jgi:release factor glutamine methyltransferase
MPWMTPARHPQFWSSTGQLVPANCHGKLCPPTLASPCRIGGGAVSRLLAEHYGCVVIGVDVNKHALRAANKQRTASSPQIELVRGDLVSWARTNPGRLFDVVVFNPPYVPTDQDELLRARVDMDIAAAWAGGHRGRQVIDVALMTVRDILARHGVFYLLVEASNDVQDVLRFGAGHGLIGQVVRQRNAGRETLHVIRFHASS